MHIKGIHGVVRRLAVVVVRRHVMVRGSRGPMGWTALKETCIRVRHVLQARPKDQGEVVEFDFNWRGSEIDNAELKAKTDVKQSIILLTVRANLLANPAFKVIGTLFSAKKSLNSSGLRFTSRKVTFPKASVRNFLRYLPISMLMDN